jgi:CelD/BcsL family acetyltransferase involved in cellulose biosynthesis
VTWTLHPATSLERFAEAWDRVNDARGGVPFLRAAFIRQLLKEFASGDELLAVYGDGSSAAAFAVLSRKGMGVWQTYQPSQLPLGAWVARPGFNLGQRLAELLRALPRVGTIIGLSQLDPLFGDRPTDGGHWQTLDYIETPWVEVSGSFETYWETRGKNLRTHMRKQRLKLEGESTPPRLEVLTASADVAQGIADYGRLESAGWKAADGTAIHPDNAQGRFYRAILEEYCGAGDGWIYRYRFGDKVVAVDLCVGSADTLVVLKTTYDESYKTLSPSSLLREDAFRRIFAEGRIKRIEFYGRLMEWHTRWTDKKRVLYHANFHRWPFLSRLRSLATGRRRQPTGHEVSPAAAPAGRAE